MLRTTLSRPTSLSTTASLSLLFWTPSRPSHAEATQPRDASSLRTPWTHLHCHPNPTIPACQPRSTMRACCCEKRPAGHGACTARPPCLPGAPRRIRPAWPGSMAELSSDGGRWPSALGEQLAGHHARPKKQVLWGRGLALRREPPQSARNCRELVCCRVQRPQQHEGLWLLFLFHCLHFHFNGFPSFHCAVDASSSYSCSPRGSVRGHDRQKSSATLQARQGVGQEPRPPPQGREAQNGIALGPSSFRVWTEELLVGFQGCNDHVGYMAQADKGATSRFAQMLPTYQSGSVWLRGWLGQLAGSGM